jgi:hypothetical protein
VLHHVLTFQGACGPSSDRISATAQELLNIWFKVHAGCTVLQSQHNCRDSSKQHAPLCLTPLQSGLAYTRCLYCNEPGVWPANMGGPGWVKAATGQTCVRATATSTCAGKYSMNGVCTSCPSGMVSARVVTAGACT